MHMKSLISVCFLAAVCATVSPAEGGMFRWGRELEDGRDFSLRGTLGQITEIDASVEETTRKLYDVTGSTWKQEDAEYYNLQDFGLTDSYPTYGASLEKIWKYFTIQFDVSFFSADATTTARRDYYIDIDGDIEYEGQSYDQMKIEEGTEFSTDLVGASIELRGQVTLFTVRPAPWLRFTPWLDLGVFGFVAEYDIDAGPVTGITQYQDPPEDFVVGGRADGLAGLAVPELGGGAELRFGTADSVNLVLQGHYAVCQYNGSTKYLTTSDHREKHVDIDHVNARARLLLEFPLKHSRSVTVGVQYRMIDSEATIESTADDPEEILETQERFDKEAIFKMDTLEAMIGFTF